MDIEARELSHHNEPQTTLYEAPRLIEHGPVEVLTGQGASFEP